MNTKHHTNNLSADTPPLSPQPSVLSPTDSAPSTEHSDRSSSCGHRTAYPLRVQHSKRSLAILIVLALIALGLTILPKPTLYYPNVVIDVTDGMQLDFLLNGQQDKTACETATTAIANAITTSCRECRTRSQACLKNPSAELKNRFNETPLPMPSARIANGIITYTAPQADIALMACQESERQAALKGNQAKVTCYPAGAARPHTAFEKQQGKAANTTFTLLLALCGGLIAALVGTIAITYSRHQHRQSLSVAVAVLAAGTARPTPCGCSPTDSVLSPERSGRSSSCGHRTAYPLRVQSSVLVPHPWLEKLTLAGVDTLILLGTFLALAWPEANDINHSSRLDRATIIGHGVVIVLTIGWFWLLLEHYTRRRPFWDELQEIIRVLAVMFMVSGAAAFVASLETGRSSHLIVWALNFLLIPLGRAGTRQLLDDLGLWQRPAVIVGTGKNARDAYLAIKSERGMGYRVLGFAKIGTNNNEPSPASGGGQGGGSGNHDTLTIGTETFPILTPMPSLESLLSAMGNPQIILALDSLTDQENQTLVQRLLATHTNIHIIPSIRGLPLFGTQLSHFFSHEVLFLTVRNNLSRRGFQWIKRTFDIVGASILLVILSPLMAYVAWRIWREDGSPVIFHQPRLAKGSGEFGFLKFRSMVKDADNIITRWRETNSPEWQEYYANNFKLKNDPRVLGVGSWIRASSIDELPQLINVLRGEMSLVGPRPLLARELPEYGDSINYYRQARPGITGLWQISGRSQTRFNDRAVLDEWYVQNWSLWYDIAILFKTIDVVFNRRGAH